MCNLGDMAKARGPVRREVVRRVERAETPLAALARLAEELAAVESDRLALLARRDALVVELRASGHSWEDVTTAAGVSRPALLKRGVRRPQ